MIRKIEHNFRKVPDPQYFNIHSIFRSWKVLWWVGVVGFLSPENSNRLKRDIKKNLHQFYKHSQDKDATFPFALEGKHTKESRFCLEAVSKVTRLFAKYQSFYSPVAFEFIFLKLDSDTLKPRYVFSSLPFEINKTTYGAFCSRASDDPLFTPQEIFLDESSHAGNFTVSVSDGCERIFEWDQEGVIQAAQSPSDSKPAGNPVGEHPAGAEMGDAGFALDFGNVTSSKSKPGTKA